MRAARRICLSFFGIVAQSAKNSIACGTKPGFYSSQLGGEPGAGERPFPISGGPRKSQGGGSILDRQAGKHPGFDESCSHRLLGSQVFQGVVQLKKAAVINRCQGLETSELDTRRELFA